MMVMENPRLLMGDVWTRRRRKILAELLGPQPLAVLWGWGGVSTHKTQMESLVWLNHTFLRGAFFTRNVGSS